MTTIHFRYDDPRAIATRERGYYLCAEVGNACFTDDGFCAHVWNWVRGWDSATLSIFDGQVLVDADPHGLDARAVADLGRALAAAEAHLIESNGA